MRKENTPEIGCVEQSMMYVLLLHPTRDPYNTYVQVRSQ